MNLLDEYPEFKNKKGMEIQRYKIAPVDVGSQHDGGSLTITKDAAETFSKQIEHTPLMYAEYDEKLPKKHTDKYNKRKVIGTGIKGFVAKDECGIDWLMGDYAIYTDAEPDIVEKIKKFRDDVSASYELRQSLIDDDGNIIDGEYEATAVVDKSHSAYRHHALLVADKAGFDEKTSVVFDEKIIKELIDGAINGVIKERDAQIESLKSELEKVKKEKENEIVIAREEINSLREITNGFSRLVN